MTHWRYDHSQDKEYTKTQYVDCGYALATSASCSTLSTHRSTLPCTYCLIPSSFHMQLPRKRLTRTTSTSKSAKMSCTSWKCSSLTTMILLEGSAKEPQEGPSLRSCKSYSLMQRSDPAHAESSAYQFHLHCFGSFGREIRG